jgi:MFS transporter, FSR family, fosmidomycin resistance protein
LPLVALVDELWSGVVVSGVDSVEHDLGLTHTRYAALTFSIPLVIAALLESIASLASETWGRRRVIVAGQGGLAAALLFVAWTTSPWGLAAGLVVAGTASGIACGAAQGVLVAEGPVNVDRALVRWALFAAIGDVLAPLVTATSIALGWSYRGAMVAVALVVLGQCAVSSGRGGSAAVAAARDDLDEPLEPLLGAVMGAMRRPRLWLWLIAAATCTLLDELVVALATIRAERDLGTRAALAASVAVAFAAGSVFGATLGDRVVARFGSRRVLLSSAAACALSLALLVGCSGPVALCVALAAVGVTCAPHHALALARAYDEVPRRPGVVQACAQLFVVVEVGAPLALGWVADRFGARAAIACLALQPGVVLACAACLAPPSRHGK